MSTEETPPKKKPSRDWFAHTGRLPNADRRLAVKAMYESGMSIRAIAARVGTTYQAVHSLLKRAEVLLRPRGGNTGSHSRHRK